jgi:Ca-activated chloride channel homolog
MKKVHFFILLTIVFIEVSVAEASLSPLQFLGGTIKTDAFGKIVDFPSLKTDIKANIKGDSVTVTVIQTFINPTNKPVHAKYLFPLNKDAAINSMVMEIGNEIVEAKIKEKKAAKKIYDDAKLEGKAASLLERHRPNMFTQNIANLIPGLPIKVSIKYIQKIPKIDNDYELVIPLIVGPRYIPKKQIVQAVGFITNSEEDKKQSEDMQIYGKWNISDIPPYPPLFKKNNPTAIEPSRVSIKVTLESGTPISEAYSNTHKIDLLGGQFKKHITLSKKSIIDNRDFILRYNLGGSDIQGGFLAHKGTEENFFSLMIEPPKEFKEENVIGRELVFVMDTSGSMDGDPLQASKIFMRHALRNLRKQDSFRIIRFSNNPSEFASRSLQANPQNLKRGLSFVNRLQANGGTELAPAIRQAFQYKQPLNMLQVIIFLSDGYVGNESEILEIINQRMNSNSRIYSFGVGTSVNRYLLNEMAYIGRGFFRVMDPTKTPHDFAIKFANKLKTPLLADIKIDWGKLEVSDVTPTKIPDLFAGETVRIYGKYKGTGIHNIRVKGWVKGRKADLPIKASLQSNPVEKENSSIPLIWANSKIIDYMRLKNTPTNLRNTKISDKEIIGKVIKLGLKYSLVTKWTSFVAVSRKIINPNPGNASNTQVPLPKVKGVTYKAYGNIYAQNFAGSSVPEPQTIFGLILIILLGFLTLTWILKARHQAANRIQGITV